MAPSQAPPYSGRREPGGPRLEFGHPPLCLVVQITLLQPGLPFPDCLSCTDETRLEFGSTFPLMWAGRHWEVSLLGCVRSHGGKATCNRVCVGECIYMQAYIRACVREFRKIPRFCFDVAQGDCLIFLI